MPSLGSLTASNKAFGIVAGSTAAVAGVGNYIWAKHNRDSADTPEELDRKMLVQLGSTAVVGTALGIAGGVTPGNTINEMVPQDKIAGNVDEAVRDISASNFDEAIRNDGWKAPSLLRTKVGGAGVGLLVGASLGVFALALATDKSPWSVAGGAAGSLG